MSLIFITLKLPPHFTFNLFGNGVPLYKGEQRQSAGQIIFSPVI